MNVLEKRQKNIVKNENGLGLSKLDRAEVVTGLNQVLANYEIHYQKLRNFHWNVKGPDFFDLHDKFEQLYKDASEKIDNIAERIRVFEHRPYSTFQEFLTNCTLKESTIEKTGIEMVNEVMSDFEILINDMTQVVTISKNTGDIGTEDLIVKFIRNVEKHYWMLKSFIRP